MRQRVKADVSQALLYTTNAEDVSNRGLANFKQPPCHGLARAKRHDRSVLPGNDGCFLGKGNRLGRRREAIDAPGVAGNERLQVVQGVVLVEKLHQHRQRHRRREHPGSAAGALFVVLRMGRRVAPEHQLGMGVEGGGEQGVAVFRALGDRLAEQVRRQEAARHVVKRQNQVMQRNRGEDVGMAVEKRHRLPCGDVLHHDAQARKGLRQVLIHRHEFRLAVHDETRALAVHQKRNVERLHQGQRRLSFLQGAHAGLAVGGDTGRIELDADDARAYGFEFGCGVGAEKQRHVRLEYGLANRRFNGRAVSIQALRIVYRRQQVGHDHRAGKRTGAQRRHEPQHLAFAQVQVHVEGRFELEPCHALSLRYRRPAAILLSVIGLMYSSRAHYSAASPHRKESPKIMATHQSISGMSDAELVERMVNSHDERHDDAFRTFFDTHVAPSLPARPAIADLGCGPGLFLRDLSRRFPGAVLYGYDLTPAMIAYAQEDVAYAGPKPTLAVHDLTAQPVPLADGSLHLVNMTAILHLLDEPLPILAEVRRLLAPEGLFFLNDWERAPLTEYLDSRVEGEGEERQDSLRRWFRLFPVHNKYTTEDWQWLLAEAGFAIRQTESLRANFRVFVTTPMAA